MAETFTNQTSKPAGNGPAPNPNLNPKQTKNAARAVADLRQSVQNHLLFSEIRDGIIIMRDGSLRMAIATSALNFDLKSPDEQGAIEYGFQGFLNGLHYPVQIIIKSRRLDLDEYLAKLDKLQVEQDNPLLADLMEDYIFNIRGLLDEVNIMDKQFYVIVPLYTQVLSKENIFTKLSGLFKASGETTQTTSQFEERKRDLIDRTNSVASGLSQIGLKVSVLKTQEIIELLYNSYNLDESVSQSLIPVGDLESPIVSETNPPNYNPPLQAQPVNNQPEPDDMYSAAAKRQVTTNQQVASPQQVSQAPNQPGGING